MTLVDTNILLDIATDSSEFFEWSLRSLERAALSGPLFINPVIYAELVPGYERAEDLEEFIQGTQLEVLEVPRPGLFLAGKVFQRYRMRGGSRTNVLPDFFIGAHASVAQMPLITRDRRRYSTYFPTVQLITPNQA